MKVAFKDDSFAFEFVRNLGFTYYGGADLGEMMATAGKIKEGDFESWFTEWDKVGRRVLSRADAGLAAGHLESAREGYLRASPTFGRLSSISMAIPRPRAFCRSPGHRRKRMPKQPGSPAQPGSRCKFPTKGPPCPDIFTRWTIPVSRAPRLFSTVDLTQASRSFSFSVAPRQCGAAITVSPSTALDKVLPCANRSFSSGMTGGRGDPCGAISLQITDNYWRMRRVRLLEKLHLTQHIHQQIHILEALNPESGSVPPTTETHPEPPRKAPVNRFRFPLAPASNPSAGISAASRPEPITH